MTKEEDKKLDYIKGKLTSRGQITALKIVEQMQRGAKNGSLYDKQGIGFFLHAFFEKHLPYVHHITPFGISIDVKKLVSECKASTMWHDQALVHDYAYHKEIGNYQHTPIPQLLFRFQTMGIGIHTIELMNQASMHPYQIIRTMPILRLERGFRYPQKDGKNLIPIQIAQALARYSSMPKLSKLHAPVTTISFDALHGFEKFAIKNPIAAKVAELCAREMAKLKSKSEISVYPLNPGYSFDDKASMHDTSTKYSIVGDDEFYVLRRESNSRSEHIGPLEMLRELHDLREKTIQKMYEQLNPPLARVRKPQEYSERKDANTLNEVSARRHKGKVF